ncbi:MAG: TatD family hydrolase [Oscillospiraceae bacterium]|nr:TatD family hydrolase [Oscillospiraceae bacterium]
MFIETHAHYDDSAFEEDRHSLLSAVHDSGIDHIIDPGCDLSSTQQACTLAEKYDFVSFAAGIHPEEVQDLPEDYPDVLRSYLCHPKCVAVGEIGLDYYWDTFLKEKQKQVFDRQLRLALEADKPVIIHDREAHGDCLETVRRYPGLRGVFHCYSGSAEMARELLKNGWYLGFDGPVTYKNARKTIEVLHLTPPDRILLETDSPYMSPVPMRGKRNDSRNLQYIAARIAEVKNLSVEEVARQTSTNARELFRLP